MIAAVLCYISCGEHVLMLHRVKKIGDIHKDKWNGLGGKMEPGESPEDALVREIKEESGFELSDYKMRATLTFPLFDGQQDWLVFLFEGYIKGEDGQCPTPPKEDCTEGNLVWKSWSEVSNLNLWEGDHIFLRTMHEHNGFFSGKFIYKDGQLLDHALELY